MLSRVELVLDKLGLLHKRDGQRLWLERCPLPAHGTHNAAHLWQNFNIRFDRGEWSGWHCFSCKQGGNLIELVAILKNEEFRVALEWVKTIGEQAPEQSILRVHSAIRPMQAGMQPPDGVEKIGAPFQQWNSVPRDYLISRGVTEVQVKEWRIGYALMGRLEGRIFLPIFDVKGRLANFAARSFTGHEKRYLAADNDRDAPDVSALFGEHRWAREKEEVVVVFEGALNGLALERAHSKCSFAGLSGSSNAGDPRVLTKLVQFRRVILATDPDLAGEKAAAEIEFALRRRAHVQRFFYPKGKDACDASVEDLSEEFRRLLAVMG